MLEADEIIKTILIEKKIINKWKLKKAEDSIQKSGKSLLDYLVEKGEIRKIELGETVAASLNLQYANLTDNTPDADTIQKLSEEYCENFHIILMQVSEEEVHVATDRPDDPHVRNTLNEIFPKRKHVLYYSLPEDIAKALEVFRKPLETTLSELLKKKVHETPQLFQAIMNDAINFDTSDIHFEPRGEEVVVRFRVDGVLREAGRMNESLYTNLLNLLKIRSNIRTDIHLQTQDGSMRFEKDRIIYDIRVSVVPTIQGQKAVLRILASYVKVLSLQQIGLTSQYQDTLEQAASKPYGLVIVAGPTGSGKTTTLYALLKAVNKNGINITTLEDPVEYRMTAVNQIQVNNEIGLTFPVGLKAIVRQDPDVILLGEIRDGETAETAISAALTGILLFTSFHAGDAAITIPRLLDMGIEPFLLASALELIMSQRLLRKICPYCKEELEIKVSDLNNRVYKPERFFDSKTIKVFRGKGCDKCGNTGYDGRTAIFETIDMTPQMKDLIQESPSAQDVRRLALDQKSGTLFEDGLIKVMSGVTTIDELLRAAQPYDLDIDKKKK